MNCLKEDFDDVFKVFNDVLRYPVFDEDKIDVAKTQANSGIARRNDDIGQITAREFNKLVYGEESPLARQIEYATVAAIKYMALREGILLDPTYSGKTFAVLLDMLRRGDFSPDQHVVFLHPGGAVSLTALSQNTVNAVSVAVSISVSGSAEASVALGGGGAQAVNITFGSSEAIISAASNVDAAGDVTRLS